MAQQVASGQTSLKILSLETSTEFCSVALHQQNEIISKETIAGNCHSEILLPMVQEVLAECGLTLSQIDGIAFGAGPGSFTGLRIACGVTQGLAFAADLPVVGISTLEAVAQKNNYPKVIVALDARMGEIYHAAYWKSTDSGWSTVCPPALCLPQHAPRLSGNEWIGCGSGFDRYQEALTIQYRENLQQICHELHPHAREITQLALPKFANGLGIDPADAIPVYIRNKVALKEKER